jgi:hypothetical protein
MSVEFAPRNDPQDITPVAPSAMLERFVERSEMVKPDEVEVVTASSGTILLIPQSRDD